MLVYTGAGLILVSAAILVSPRWADIPDGEYGFRGTVIESGFMRGTYRMMLDDVCIGGQDIRGYALFSVYDCVHGVKKGSVIEGPVRVRGPRANGNTGEFDYREYLLGQGVTLHGYIKDLSRVNILHPGGGERLRDDVVSELSRYARPEAEVLKAVITGDCSGLVYSLRDSFASLGIAHLIAISGLNMGIMFLFGYVSSFTALRLTPPLSRRLDTPFIAKMVGLACVCIYTDFVGGSLPAVRSAIMVACVVLSVMLTRKGDLIESLSLAGIVILLWMPYSLFSSSFLLSFSAVLGIIGIYRRLRDCPRWTLYIAVPLVATAFTLPITVIHFGFVSLSGFIANIVFVPWFSFVIMPLGIAGIIFSPVSTTLSQAMFSLSFDAIGIIFTAADLWGHLYPVACPGAIWSLICYCGLISAFFSRASKLRTAIISACILFIVGIPVVLHIHRDHQPLCFDFISVGQGDSILVTKGRRAILIDAGGSRTGFDTGRFIVGPHLLRRGVTSLDLVVATHSHPDHIGGIPYILDRFPTAEIWTNVKYDWSPDFRSVIHIAERNGIVMKNVCLGDVRRLHGVDIEVLSPIERISTRRAKMDLNLQSIVLMVGDDRMKGLFMGDAGGLGEIRLCRLDRDLSADVLKVGHHGSKNACQTMFIQRVAPKVAVIPVGLGNTFNLPNRSCLDRLEHHGIATYRTDLHGEIDIRPGKNALQVRSGGKVIKILCR